MEAAEEKAGDTEVVVRDENRSLARNAVACSPNPDLPRLHQQFPDYFPNIAATDLAECGACRSSSATTQFRNHKYGRAPPVVGGDFVVATPFSCKNDYFALNTNDVSTSSMRTESPRKE